MKNIAIFIDNLGIGGIQKSVINILNSLDYQKYNIDLYLFDKDIFYKNEIPKNVNMIFLERSNKISKFIPFNLGYKLNKKSYFDKSNVTYDIAIDFDSYQFDTAINAIKCPSARKIMWIHNDVINERKYNFKYRILHHFMRGKYKYFNEYVGVSEGVIEPFKKLNKQNDKLFYVIPNIIKTDEIFNKSKETIDDIIVDNNKYNLISVGRLCHQKGYDIFLKDYKEIVAKRKDIHFYLIGDGDKLEELIKLTKKYHLEDYITFVGKKTNPFKYENIMDGFVLTSRYEGQGMVILEAISLGLDIFITKNIEKYNGYNVKGTNDIISAIINAKKPNKKRDDLKKYNDNIISKLNNLFNQKQD